MDQILQGLPGVHCILDDMIVTGKTDKEHLRNLDSVLQRLQKFGLRANLEKCFFFIDSVQYCGHEVTKDGIWKTKDKIDAVLRTSAPENLTQLRSFLGLVNYYNRFLAIYWAVKNSILIRFKTAKLCCVSIRIHL